MPSANVNACQAFSVVHIASSLVGSTIVRYAFVDGTIRFSISFFFFAWPTAGAINRLLHITLRISSVEAWKLMQIHINVHHSATKLKIHPRLAVAKKSSSNIRVEKTKLLILESL